MSTRAAAAAPAPETVLVVESDVLQRLVIADYLRECGYKVIEAASAEEALRLVGQFRASIDTVFSALELTGAMDGFALATWVHQNCPGLDVILAGTLPRAASQAAELCRDGPLPKTYEPTAVVERLRSLRTSRASKPRSQ